MKLYHESNILIREIDFSRCRPYKDFGQGFYLTEIEEQATKMAERTATIYGGKGIVSVFEFDREGAYADKELSIKEFTTPNEEWALFVMGNRSIHFDMSGICRTFGMVSNSCPFGRMPFFFSVVELFRVHVMEL